MLSDGELRSIDKHTGPNSILIVGAEGQLHRLRCPFHVIVLVQVLDLQPEMKVIVDAVKVSRHVPLVYSIGGKGYAYWNFRIVEV